MSFGIRNTCTILGMSLDLSELSFLHLQKGRTISTMQGFCEDYSDRLLNK